MNEREKDAFGSLLIATLEVYGTKLSPAALSIWTAAVSDYSLEQLRGALSAYVKTAGTGHFAPKPADLIELLAGNDGRPGAEVAWTSVPHSEQATAVWTEDAQQAFFAGACHLLQRGDLIGARMAFKEAYERIVKQSRAGRKPLSVLISKGWDANDQQLKIAEAVSTGLITLERAKNALPTLEYHAQPATNLKIVS